MTTYQYFTGTNIYNSNCDAFNLFNSFPVKKFSLFFFKKILIRFCIETPMKIIH